MRRWLFVIMVVTLCSLTTWAQDFEPVTQNISAGAIGNENQIGGWFGLTGKYTTIGFDGRYVSDYGDTDESTEILSIFVSWNAVPKITIPISGLIPQFNLPGPESIDVQLNIIGRLGFETENEDVIATLGAELELLSGDRASLAVRYEYSFSEAIWSDLSNQVGQHQAFLNLKYKLN